MLTEIKSMEMRGGLLYLRALSGDEAVVIVAAPCVALTGADLAVRALKGADVIELRRAHR